MKLFWFHFRAFWHGFFHMFDSHQQRQEYAKKQTERYFRELFK